MILQRLLIILFWMSLFLGALYLPSLPIFGKKEKSLTVFAWGDILDPTLIAQFEKESGIKIHLNYYASNEELLVKLKATEGQGYDLIIPSDYSVQTLKEENLLKPLDKSKLTFLSQINPILLNHPFDPGNLYSVPLEWELFVLGINLSMIEEPLIPSWDLIFKPTKRIAMINDPVQAIALAGFYLYGNQRSVSSEEMGEIVKLLSQQKQWVTAYADFRADYFLASKNCPIVVSSTSYITRTMKRFPFVSFIVPMEGTFVTIENLCIPKATKKEQLAYQFMNFLYQKESMKTLYQTYGVFPATTDSLEDLQAPPEIKTLLHTSVAVFKKFHFTRPLASQQEIRNAWIEIKSSNKDLNSTN